MKCPTDQQTIVATFAPSGTVDPDPGDARNKACAALMQTFVQGDDRAFSRLYELTVDRVSAIARGVLESPEDQQEVIGDIYMFVWKRAATYDRQRGSVDAWLAMITKSRAVDRYRHRRCMTAVDRRYEQEVAGFLTSEAPGADQVLCQDQASQALHRALETLTPLRRRLIGLAFFRGMSHSDIASSTDIPVGTVKSHVRRALACLKAEIAACV